MAAKVRFMMIYDYWVKLDALRITVQQTPESIGQIATEISLQASGLQNVDFFQSLISNKQFAWQLYGFVILLDP